MFEDSHLNVYTPEPLEATDYRGIRRVLDEEGVRI